MYKTLYDLVESTATFTQGSIVQAGAYQYEVTRKKTNLSDPTPAARVSTKSGWLLKPLLNALGSMTASAFGGDNFSHLPFSEKYSSSSAADDLLAYVKEVGCPGVFDVRISRREALVLPDSDQNYYFLDLLVPLPKLNSSVWGADEYMINVTGRNVTLHGPKLECMHRANGIRISSGSVYIDHAKIKSFTNVGVLFAGSAGNNVLFEPEITQIDSTDLPRFNVDSNYTGTCIKFTRPDDIVIGGISRWAGICVHFTDTATTCQLIRHHPYNGRPSIPNEVLPRKNPKLIRVDRGASNINIFDCYLDNGQIDLYTDSTRLRNNMFLCNTKAVEYTEKYVIGIHPSVANQGMPTRLDIDTYAVSNLPADFKFLDFRSSASAWWAVSMTPADIVGLTSGVVRVNGPEHSVITSPNTADGNVVSRTYKPVGTMQYIKQLGSGQEYTETYGSSYQLEINGVNRFRVNPSKGVSIGPAAPHSSAALDIQSSDGFLIVPRITSAARDNQTPIAGAIIYNTTINKFQGRIAGAWVDLNT
jgi:hypothetical protein